MTSTFTANKNLEEPANGDYVNDWNVPVNANFTAIDTALGGNVTINVTGVSGTVALTTAQYQPFYIILTGTLTANIVYQFPSGVGGQWTVKNGTTGAFTVTFGSAGGGSSYVVPQGTNSNILSDGTNVQAIGISSFSAGSTGLTPATASNGAIILGGTLAVASGGTGTTTSTGTGSVVLSTGPTLTAPTVNSPTISGGTFSNSSLTGTPIAPTAGPTTNTQQIATTAFVQNGGNSQTQSGYQYFPSGLLLQWGTTGIVGDGSLSFPIPFPNNCFTVTSSTNGILWCAILNITNTGFTFEQRTNVTGYSNATGSVRWMAIGN